MSLRLGKFLALDAIGMVFETKAADPAVIPAFDKMEGFNSDVLARSIATGFSRDQFGTSLELEPLQVWY